MTSLTSPLANGLPKVAVKGRSGKRGPLLGRLSHSFWKRFWRVGYFLSIHLFRWAERIFGSDALPWLLAPSLYWDFARRLGDYGKFKRLRAYQPPSYWRGVTPLRHYFIMIRTWHSTLATALLFDRLREPGWEKRITVRGTPPRSRADWGTRPIITVFMHTGGFGVLRFWLKAQGIPTISYVASMPAIVTHPAAMRMFQAGDVLYGLPQLIQTYQGARDLRATLDFLQPGRILTMALDAGRTSSTSNIYQAENCDIHLSSVVLRLACATNAVLLPVSIVAKEEICSFELRFGTALPDELLDRKNPHPAVQFLLDQLWQDVREDPTVLGWTAMEALAPHLASKHQPWP